MKSINRKENKHFRLFGFILLLSIFYPYAGYAQGSLPTSGFAGPDKKTCWSQTNSKTNPVQIGKPAIPGYCYSWSPVEFVSDPHAADPMAWFDGSTTQKTYTVTVTGTNFSFRTVESVTLSASDPISILASKKYCCYKAKETLIPSMFNITTNPPGLENIVTFSPAVFPNQAAYQYNVMVTVYTKCYVGGNSGTTASFIVTVVNPDYQEATSVGIPTNLSQSLISGSNKLKKIIEAYQRMSDEIPSPCGGSIKYELESPYAKSKICCPDQECIMDSYIAALSWELGYDYKCDFPFAGIPYVASVNLRPKLGVSIGLQGKLTQNCEDGEICFSLTPESYGSMGVSVLVAGGAIIDAALDGVVKISISPCQVCIYPAWKVTTSSVLSYQIDVVGSVTLLSTAKLKKVNYPILDKKVLCIF